VIIDTINAIAVSVGIEIAGALAFVVFIVAFGALDMLTRWLFRR
jgi:hypothetical protein